MTERVKRGGNSEDYQAMFLADVVGGSDVADGQALIWDEVQERFAPGDAGGSASYLVYTAMLNQNGSDPPIPTVFRNTLGGAPAFVRGDAGTYFCDLSGISFPEGSVIFSPVDLLDYLTTLIYYIPSGVSGVNIFSTSGGSLADDVLSSTPLEFRVYIPEA